MNDDPAFYRDYLCSRFWWLCRAMGYTTAPPAFTLLGTSSEEAGTTAQTRTDDATHGSDSPPPSLPPSLPRSLPPNPHPSAETHSH